MKFLTIFRLANHVRGEISLEKIMMISSKFFSSTWCWKELSWNVSRKHNQSCSQTKPGRRKEKQINTREMRLWISWRFQSLYLPDIDFYEAIYKDRKFNSIVISWNKFGSFNKKLWNISFYLLLFIFLPILCKPHRFSNPHHIDTMCDCLSSFETQFVAILNLHDAQIQLNLNKWLLSDI